MKCRKLLITQDTTMSPSARGAWIEILVADCRLLWCWVAPRTGGVD